MYNGVIRGTLKGISCDMGIFKYFILKKRDELKASITIYFVFAIVLIIAVILSVTEIARINCQKLYLQIATDSSLDSMASLYHRKLYEYYNLYGVEYRTKEKLITEYLSYIEPYFKEDFWNLNLADVSINNWYGAKINAENIDLNYKLLIDEKYMEREIVAYMKTNLIGRAIDFMGQKIFLDKEEDMEKLVDSAKEITETDMNTTIYKEIYNRYFNFTDRTIALEKAAIKVENDISRTNREIQNCSNIAISAEINSLGQAVYKLEGLKEAVESLDESLSTYQEVMAEYREAVLESKAQYLEDKASGQYDITEDVDNFVISEFEHFENEVDENSEMNRAVEAGHNNLELILVEAREYESSIRSYTLELEMLNAELDSERNAEEKDQDVINDLREQIKELKDEIKEYIKTDVRPGIKEMVVAPLDLGVSNTDISGKKSLLTKLINAKDGWLLTLVLDEDKIKELGTKDNKINVFNILSNNNTFSLEKILLGEYELEKFNYFNKDLNKEETKSGSVALEVERLINGKDNDKANIQNIINRILLIRIAMDVLYVYKTPELRQAIRTFANMIVGVGRATILGALLAEALFLLLITAVGTAQAIVDVKKLLKNYKVRFFHDKTTWSVDVNNIFDMITEGLFDTEDKDDDGIALSYKDYLRFFLLMTKQHDINDRMAGMMEYNIKKEDNKFAFDKLIYSFKTKNSFVCEHFFTNMIWISAKNAKLFGKYKIEAEGYIDYIDLIE